jgi:hypothetical protein
VLRIISALILGGVLITATTGAAASLGGIRGSSLGADDALVESCDVDGVTATYDLQYTGRSYDVVGVIVGEIDSPRCDNARVQITLTRDGQPMAMGMGAAVGGKAMVRLDKPVPAKLINDIHIVITL